MGQLILASFKVSSRWWDGIWGGGHTIDTDPSKQGWRASLSAKGSSTLVVGRPGQRGCASVQQLSDGRVDVALYEDATPDDVVKGLAMRRGDPARVELLGDPIYMQLAMIPGWGLAILERLAELV